MFCDILRAPNLGALLTPPGIITITGGGGKTSLLHALLISLRAEGVCAIGATTTKTFVHDRHEKEIIVVSSAADCLKAASRARLVDKSFVLCSGIDPLNVGKALGVQSDWLDQVSQHMPECLFIVEGDGSAGKSIKGHLPYEPVIPQTSKLVIPVVGLDVVGLPVNDMNVHRVQRFNELTQAKYGEPITSLMVAQVLCHPEGYRHNVPAQAAVIPFLNKAENSERFSSAIAICRALSHQNSSCVPGTVVIGSIDKREYSVRKLKH